MADAFAARALEEQRALKTKKRNIKINEELQKVKTQELLYEWKEDYRTSQQQLRRKRLVKGKGNHLLFLSCSRSVLILLIRLRRTCCSSSIRH